MIVDKSQAVAMELFTAASTNQFDIQQLFISEAQRLSIDIQLSKMTERDVKALSDIGCDALVVAGYRWKIPDTRQFLPFE